MNIEPLLNLIFVIGTLLVTLVFGFVKLKSLKSRIILLVVILISAIIFTYSFFVPSGVFGRDAIQNFILKFGIFSIIGLILMQILQVLIPPLDHNVTQFIGGFLFGPYLGFIYNFIGRTLGSVLAFLIGRKYGRNFLKRVTPYSDIEKYDKIWNKNLVYIFLAYWLPFFPDDTISYLAGISKVKLKLFFLILLIGQPVGVLGTTLMGTLGETVWFKSPVFWIVGIVTLLTGLVVFGFEKFRKRI